MEENVIFDDIIKENTKKQKASEETKAKKKEEKISDNEIFIKDIVTEVIPKDQLNEEHMQSTDRVVELIFDKTQVMIMKLVKDNPRISVDEVAQEAGISKQEAIDNLRSLISKHMILRVKDGEDGHWETTYHYREMY